VLPVIAGATPFRNRLPGGSSEVFHTNPPRSGLTPFQELTAVAGDIVSPVVSSAADSSKPR
jgi:hypothetical protein